MTADPHREQTTQITPDVKGFRGRHPVQLAWIEEQVPQCGYCQTGQIMQAVAVLEQNPEPTREQIRQGMEGTLAAAVTLPLRSNAAGPAAVEPPSVTAQLEIAADSNVILHSPTTEMGQGTHTGHAVIIADDLGVDLERVGAVTAQPADAFRRGGQMSSGGSTGVRYWYQPLRKAAAQARAMLVADGAARWGVAAAECPLKRGDVVHRAPGRGIGIGALASAAAALPLPADPRVPDLAASPGLTCEDFSGSWHTVLFLLA